MSWNGRLLNTAVCEWCGHTEVQQDDAIQIVYCASCRNPTMRGDCPGCHAPIMPQKDFCLQCGIDFVVTGEKRAVGFMGMPVEPRLVNEPDAQERAFLSMGGEHWYDVKRIRAAVKVDAKYLTATEILRDIRDESPKTDNDAGSE